MNDLEESQATIEWSRAGEAAHKLQAALASEISYLTDGINLRNVYSPIAWIRTCRAIRTVTDGMICMRLAAQGKSSHEIHRETGIARGSIAAYRAWNTMYADAMERSLAARGKTEKQRQADLEFLQEIGVQL